MNSNLLYLNLIISYILLCLHFRQVHAYVYGMIAYFEDTCPDDWEEYTKSAGRVIISRGSTYDSRGENRVFKLGETGGEFSHVMTIYELARHFHQTGVEALYHNYGGGIYVGPRTAMGGGLEQYFNANTSSSGDSQPSNIIYIQKQNITDQLQNFQKEITSIQESSQNNKQEIQNELQKNQKESMDKYEKNYSQIQEFQQKSKQEIQNELQKGQKEIMEEVQNNKQEYQDDKQKFQKDIYKQLFNNKQEIIEEVQKLLDSNKSKLNEVQINNQDYSEKDDFDQKPILIATIIIIIFLFVLIIFFYITFQKKIKLLENQLTLLRQQQLKQYEIRQSEQLINIEQQNNNIHTQNNEPFVTQVQN